MRVPKPQYRKLDKYECGVEIGIKRELHWEPISDALDKYVCLTCRRCKGSMLFRIAGPNYREDYRIECPTCKRAVVLTAGTG